MQTQYATAASYNASDYSGAAVRNARTTWHFMPMRYPLRIKEHRKLQGLTQAQLGDAVGFDQSTVQRWEQGKRQPDLRDINNLANALNVTPGDLFADPNRVPIGPRLFVKGNVGAGLWREAFELPEDDWEPFNGRPDVSSPVEMRFGLRVVGDSMNELYPHGTVLECVSIMGNAEIESGKRVIVQRTRPDGDLEATVKELRIERDGSKWLVPRSSNPAFQTPLRVGADEPDIETAIIAVVVSSYRPE